MEKKSFGCLRLSQNVLRKSCMTRVLNWNVYKYCSFLRDMCLRVYCTSYFLAALEAATAADFVILPWTFGFFSTSLITPTATV